MQIMMHGDDVTVIGVTVMEVVEAVEFERTVDESTSRKTRLRPVLPVSSLT
jgi:hypothetical protein